MLICNLSSYLLTIHTLILISVVFSSVIISRRSVGLGTRCTYMSHVGKDLPFKNITTITSLAFLSGKPSIGETSCIDAKPRRMWNRTYNHIKCMFDGPIQPDPALVVSPYRQHSKKAARFFCQPTAWTSRCEAGWLAVTPPLVVSSFGVGETVWGKGSRCRTSSCLHCQILTSVSGRTA